jgi:protein TonB
MRQVGAGDRLALTACLAMIVHAMLVFGVGFSPRPMPKSAMNSLEVILVTQRSPTVPDDARMLAQENLEGGGDAEELERPATPLTAPFPDPRPEVAAVPTPALAPELPKQPESRDALTDSMSVDPREGTRERVAQQRPELAVDDNRSRQQRPDSDARPTAQAELDETEQPRPPQPEVSPRPLPSAAQLITSSFALASLNAELQQRLNSRAQRPRRKYISASTQEYRYAAYMEAWRAKVERVGNLNYPEDARKRNLSGSLLLDVELFADGSIGKITVRKSSGSEILDAAAVRIVELAAPFARFPDDIARDVDILHVTRTWQFRDTGDFASR